MKRKPSEASLKVLWEEAIYRFMLDRGASKRAAWEMSVTTPTPIGVTDPYEFVAIAERWADNATQQSPRSAPSPYTPQDWNA